MNQPLTPMRITENRGLIIVDFNDTPRNQYVRLELQITDAMELAEKLTAVLNQKEDKSAEISKKTT